MDEASVLRRQQAYYDARALEYDDWWLRRGRYDLGAEQRAMWEDEIDELRSWLAGLAPLGRVLELAAGTGNWTAELVALADEVVAVDGSAEALAINRAKLESGAPVELVSADVFELAPARRFDTVFFSFWLSHVPPGRRAAHWNLVRRSLVDGGRIVLIDNAHPDRVASSGFPRVDGTRESMVDASGRETRTLADGRSFEIVKHYWRPSDLALDADRHGVELEVDETTHYFLRACGRVLDQEPT